VAHVSSGNTPATKVKKEKDDPARKCSHKTKKQKISWAGKTRWPEKCGNVGKKTRWQSSPGEPRGGVRRRGPNAREAKKKKRRKAGSFHTTKRRRPTRSRPGLTAGEGKAFRPPVRTTSGGRNLKKRDPGVQQSITSERAEPKRQGHSLRGGKLRDREWSEPSGTGVPKSNVGDLHKRTGDNSQGGGKRK